MSNKNELELNDIRQGFHMFTSNQNGLINPNELKEIMEIMNIDEKNPFIYNIINNICSDYNITQKGGIDVDDFISLIDQELSDASSIEGLQSIFESLCNPSSNTISLQQISQIDKNNEENEIMKKLLSRPEIKEKEIDFIEFKNIMEIDKDNKNKNISKLKSEKVYKKKISMGDGRENYKNINKKTNKSENNNYDNDNNNNAVFDNNIKKVEFNFIDKGINNNNSNKFNDSVNSSEKMENLFSSGNKSFSNLIEENVNEINGCNDSDNKINDDKDENINSFDNNDNYYKNKIIKRIENIEILEEPIEEEEVTVKKKYRHMRKYQSNHLDDKKNKEESEIIEINYEEKKNTNVPYRANRYTKGRISNNDSKNEDDENKDDKNENNIDDINDRQSLKRYHRRYRENKTSPRDKNEDKFDNNKNNNLNGKENNITSSSHSRYRKNN